MIANLAWADRGTWARRWGRAHWWHVLFILALLGQFLAPVFTIVHIWPFASIARFIYWLGATICPIAWDTPTFLGHPMIVCPLCYGALVMITLVTFAYPRPVTLWARWHAISIMMRSVVIMACITPWLAAYIFIKASIGTMGWSTMFFLGLLGGLGTTLLAFQMIELGRPRTMREGHPA